MGISRWSAEDWDGYVKSSSGKSAAELFKGRCLDKELDPKGVIYRESCDSALNPLSTPIIVAIDETGSMGFLAETLIRKGLGIVMDEIYDRKPVTDPHLMCMAVGDAWCDQAPLQVTQFEADLRLADQVSKFYIEGNGGGNSYESYNLPWYFAATRTKCDALLKRNKKGYLFTVGDEPPAPKLLAQHVERFLGGGLQHDLNTREVLNLATKTWEVFHIIIAEGSYAKRSGDAVKQEWRQLLGQRAIVLSDHAKLSELIVSTIQMMEGLDLSKIERSWAGGTGALIRRSLKELVPSARGGGRGVVRF
ncbi:MAG TPA: hypothetical protein V6C81_25115 [Planktothrix sp.]|jgi:hypothetical protein